jgi:hypothetical protein
MRAVTNRKRHGKKCQEMEEYNQSKKGGELFVKAKESRQLIHS